VKKHKKPYSERSDAEKISSNWHKTMKLFQRREYSVCVIRAATCVELAANLMVRAELIQQRGLPVGYVEHLMHWANGLGGKLQHLLIPLFDGTSKHAAIKAVSKNVLLINRERNSVAHRGEFKGKQAALKVLMSAREIALTMVRFYDSSFTLPEP
jgi:hypothetical protein